MRRVRNTRNALHAPYANATRNALHARYANAFAIVLLLCTDCAVSNIRVAVTEQSETIMQAERMRREAEQLRITKDYQQALNIFQKVCRKTKEHNTSPPETFVGFVFAPLMTWLRSSQSLLRRNWL
jgi:hypothetical protein